MDPIRNRNAHVAAFVPIGLFLLLFVFLFARFGETITLGAGTLLADTGRLFVIFLIPALAALGARALLTPLLRVGQPEPGSTDPNILLRSRIAPFILALGGTAILVLALALIIALSMVAPREKIDSLLLGVFGSVLPILATWVGTVIAFYFTNESYRQAAEATAAAAGARASGPKVTERMIPYADIVKIEVARSGARAVRMDAVDALMQEPITRLVVFDATTRSPIFVIRRKLYPSAWIIGGTALSTLTIQDYLDGNGGTNAIDASLFGFVAPGATLEEARAVLRETKSADLFVTLTGQKSEAALGWLTDDRLKAG
jgi:hypothetical protein